MGRKLDEDAFIKFLANRGGGIWSTKSGVIPGRLANVLGIAPNAVSAFLQRMERDRKIVVDRGPAGRFIYGVRLVTPPKQDAITSGYVSAPDQMVATQPNATISLVAPDLEDYSNLAAKLLEKAVDALVENERLRERVAYLEGKISEQPVTLDEHRRNIIKELQHQAGED